VTRTEIAEQALARAQEEDAKDASLLPCKLCGSRAVRKTVDADTSMHRGWAQIRCERGDQEIVIRPDEMRRPLWHPKQTFAQVDGLRLDMAEAEAIRRWQVLNG
jgi:hypothetical protein